MPRKRRQGIVYDVRESGVARLVFDDDRKKFRGVLETTSGEVMHVSGIASPQASTSNDDCSRLMDVHIIDGEEGSVFHVLNVQLVMDGSTAKLESPAIQFESEDRMIGMKAAVEIQQHISADMADESNEVFVGNMKIHLLTSHRPTESIRRESTCESNMDIKILEASDDFLA